MFWNKKKKAQPSPEENRIATLADRLQQQGRIDQLESELRRFDPSSLEGSERESWYHLYGVASFQQGKRRLAFQRFQEGVRQCPDSGRLLFSLGQEWEFQGNSDQMLACFDKATFPKVPAPFSLAQARYAYLWGDFDRARAYIEPLFPVYLQLKILDTTFLYIRGLPFFSQAWDYLAAFSKLDGNFGALTNLTAKAESEYSDLDFDKLNTKIEWLQGGELSRLKKSLCESVQQAKAHNVPSGYQELQLAILLSQESNDHNNASSILEGLIFSSADFPWLEDMRLLARCEQAGKFSDSSGEAELRALLLERQPLLFEPDHAMNFNLLEYQESLKKDYQRVRMSNAGT